MDVIIGAAVTGPVARLALVDGSSGESGNVIDQSTVDLGSDPAAELADAIVGTQRLLADDGHRLVATRICWTDEAGVHDLHQRLTQAGIPDVAVVRQSDAALAKVREVSQAATTSPAAARGSAALLYCDDDTVTLSIVGADASTATVWAVEKVVGSDTAAACTTLLTRLSGECRAAESLCLMGASPNIGDVARQIRGATPIPLMIPDDAELAFAHGATLAGFAAERVGDSVPTTVIEPEERFDSLAMGSTGLSPQIGPQLAYSMVDDSNSLPLLGNSRGAGAGHIPNQSKMSPLSWADDDDEDDDTVATGAVSARPRFLLLGSGVAAAVVIAFAALAVTVAIGIKPDPQRVAAADPRAHAMPQFFPLPTNPKAPIPTAPDSLPTVEAKNASLPPGGAIPAELASAIGAPAAIPPGAPAPFALPDVPPAPMAGQMPGWGMPGFVMPPIIFNVPSPYGTPYTGWHWVTNGQGTSLWVPNSVQGLSTVSLNNQSTIQNGSGTSVVGAVDPVRTPNGNATGQVPVLGLNKNGQPVLTLGQTPDALPGNGTDKNTVPTLGTDQQKNGVPVLADPGKSAVPGQGGLNKGLIPDSGGVKTAPGPHVELVPALKPDNLPVPDKPLAPPVAPAPAQLPVVPRAPVQVPEQQPVVPKAPVAPAPLPEQAPPAPKWTPPVQQAPVWTPPPAPKWIPPVQQAPEPPVFHAPAPPPVIVPPAMPSPPIFRMPPIFGGGGGGGGGLPGLFGGGRHH